MDYELCRLCGYGHVYPEGGYTACNRCRAACIHLDGWEFVTIKKVNGVKDVRRQCVICSHREAGVKHADVEDVDTLRVVVDHHAKAPGRTCARCGDLSGVESHHWAPRAIFGFYEAERWPQSDLCRSCHGVWHQQMRLAAGFRLPRGQRIDDMGGVL